MWFDYESSVYVNEDDFDEMVAAIKRGGNIDEVFDYWRDRLDDGDYQEVLYVGDKIKDELRRRLNA